VKIHRDLLTEDKANSTWEPLRIAFAIAFLTAVGLQIFDVVVNGKEFDVQAFGIGIGGLILTTGGGLWASSNQKDEP